MKIIWTFIVLLTSKLLRVSARPVAQPGNIVISLLHSVRFFFLFVFFFLFSSNSFSEFTVVRNCRRTRFRRIRAPRPGTTSHQRLFVRLSSPQTPVPAVQRFLPGNRILSSHFRAKSHVGNKRKYVALGNAVERTPYIEAIVSESVCTPTMRQQFFFFNIVIVRVRVFYDNNFTFVYLRLRCV